MGASMHDALVATDKLPEDHPELDSTGLMYEAGWRERAQAIDSYLAGHPGRPEEELHVLRGQYDDLMRSFREATVTLGGNVLGHFELTEPQVRAFLDALRERDLTKGVTLSMPNDGFSTLTVESPAWPEAVDIETDGEVSLGW